VSHQILSSVSLGRADEGHRHQRWPQSLALFERPARRQRRWHPRMKLGRTTRPQPGTSV